MAQGCSEEMLVEKHYDEGLLVCYGELLPWNCVILIKVSVYHLMIIFFFSFLKDEHKIPLEDLEARLSTDVQKVRVIYYGSLQLVRKITLSPFNS